MTATHALGWALVHFLWPARALAIRLAIGLAVTRPTAARARYALSRITVCAVLAPPIATGLRLVRSGSSTIGTSPRVPAPQESVATSAVPAAPRTAVIDNPTIARPHAARSLRAWLEPWLGWFVVVWVAGVLVLSVRLGRSWLAARRLRSEATRDSSPALVQMLERLAARLR